MTTHLLRRRLASATSGGVAPWALATRLLKEALAAAPALREVPAGDPDRAFSVALGGSHIPVVELPPPALLERCGAAAAPLVALWPEAAPPAMAGLERWFPADGVELAVAWAEAVARRGPTVIVLPDWLPPVLDRPAPPRLRDVARGEYLAADAPEGMLAPSITIVATGVELPAALELRRALASERVGLRVIAAPCPDRAAA